MRILVVDLSSIARKFFELDKDGRLSDGNAFSASLNHITRARDGFDRLVIARDMRPSFRHFVCPTYKQGRENPGAVYTKLESDLVERLWKDGAKIFPNKTEASDPQFEIKPGGFPEADDIIASIASWYADHRSEDWELVIASEDSDLAALVDDSAKIAMRRFDGTIWNEADVFAKFKCNPREICDLKTIGGDDGDGYKPFPHPTKEGGPGIGPTTALKLLATWGGYTGAEPGASRCARVLIAAESGEAGVKDAMPDSHERRCLLAGGRAAMMMAFECARMLDQLPLGFDRILKEPEVRPIANVEPKAVEVAPIEPSTRGEAPVSAIVLSETQALARPRRDKNQIERYALQPRSFDELCRSSELLFDARMFPQFSNWQGIAGAAMIAAEQGIGIGQALRGTYVVEGKLAFSAALIASLVRRSASCKTLRLVTEECDDKRATVEFWRDDMAKPAKYVFTIAMAERMKGGKLSGRDPAKKTKWETQPHLMLCWAALREVCRLWWYDIAAGMYTPDELRAGQDLTDTEFEATSEQLQ